MTHMTRNLLKSIMYKDTIDYDMQNTEVRSLFLRKFQICIGMNRDIKKIERRKVSSLYNNFKLYNLPKFYKSIKI